MTGLSWMAHRIGRHEAIGDGALAPRSSTIVAASARGALPATASAEERVHRARQRLKRARSLLRVLKPVIGDEAADLPRALADAARLLAGARDADVAAASARGLRALVRGRRRRRASTAIVADLDRKAEEAHQRPRFRSRRW